LRLHCRTHKHHAEATSEMGPGHSAQAHLYH